MAVFVEKMMRLIFRLLALPIESAIFLSACVPSPKDIQMVEALPNIFPDYINVTVPAEIAPLNFNVMYENTEAVEVKVEERGEKNFFDSDCVARWTMETI